MPSFPTFLRPPDANHSPRSPKVSRPCGLLLSSVAIAIYIPMCTHTCIYICGYISVCVCACLRACCVSFCFLLWGMEGDVPPYTHNPSYAFWYPLLSLLRTVSIRGIIPWDGCRGTGYMNHQALSTVRIAQSGMPPQWSKGLFSSFKKVLNSIGLRF